MAITWTIFVLGALLQDMQCNSMESTTSASTESTSSNSANPAKSVSEVSISTTLQTPISSASSNPTILSTMNLISTTLKPTTPDTNTNLSPSIATTSSTKLIHNSSTITPTKLISPSVSPLKSTTNTLKDSTLSLTTLTILTTKEQTQQPRMSDSPQVTTQITTLQPTIPNTNTSPTDSTSPTNLHSPPFSQETTSSSTPAVTTHKENGTSPDNQTDPSAVTTNPAPKPTSIVSQSTQKQETQTTSAPITSTTLPATSRPDYLTTSTSTPGNLTYPVFDLSHSSEGNVVLEACKMLGQKMKGNCSATLDIQGNKLIATITINADQIIETESYKPLEQKDDVILKKEPIPDTLIAILASSGALVLILCCFAAYCTYHRRSYRKNQQHLTEELQTVENGYHDNPTLEVMEVQPEMQEKKLTLNGEFNDSWIVPIDNLLKEDLPDEEDTHL